MDGWKLLGRNENDLKNEIKIVHTNIKDLNTNFGLEKICKNMFKMRQGKKQNAYRKHI